MEERVETTTDAGTRPEHVTVINERERSGSGGVIVALIALVVIALIAFWVIGGSSNESPDAGISAAADKVGAAAEKVGAAADEATQQIQ